MEDGRAAGHRAFMSRDFTGAEGPWDKASAGDFAARQAGCRTRRLWLPCPARVAQVVGALRKLAKEQRWI
jgi:hypothetical protein